MGMFWERVLEPVARWTLWTAAAAAVLVGCTQPDSATETMEPTLEMIQEKIFAKACASGCHDAQVRAGDLDLSSAEASYEALVNMPADNDVAFENRWLRVKPGDAERSFLVRKMRQPGLGEGAPMPMGPMGVHEEWMALVEAWINDGAKR